MIWPHMIGQTCNLFYNFYMAVVVRIASRCGLRFEVCHRNKTKLALYKLLLLLKSHLKQLYISNKMENFSYKEAGVVYIY